MPSAVEQLIPLEIRNAQDAAWDKYASVCRGGTKQEREWAYKKARKQDERFRQAYLVAEKEYKRQQARATSGSGKAAA